MTRLAILALAATLTPASAQMVCNEVPEMLAELASRYGEHPLSSGVSLSGRHVIITTNPERGTWSFLVIMPDGQSCMAAAGTDWKMLPQGEPM